MNLPDWITLAATLGTVVMAGVSAYNARRAQRALNLIRERSERDH